jgi:alanine racemase
MMNNERACAYVDLSVIEYNYSSIKALLPDKVKILCVVKADAYGHGSIEIAKKLESLGANYLGVATINEGLELRNNGISIPILVMSGILTEYDIDYVYKYMLTPVVYDIGTLRKLKEESLNHDEKLKIHIKLDTGMGRLGFTPDELPVVIKEIKEPCRIDVEGFMSHFASSENRDEYGFKQVATFKKALQVLEQSGIKPELVHMGNSGAITQYPEAHFDMVRVGIALYGSYPSKDLSKILHIIPAMKLSSRIAIIKEFPPGSSLSYGRTFTTERKTRIAYVPIGYADGYPRSLSNKGSVLINDRRCNVAGRICMDWLLVDITDKGNMAVGEEVILLGKGINDSITADEIAEHTGTIPYEILCKISKRVPRIYVQ